MNSVAVARACRCLPQFVYTGARAYRSELPMVNIDSAPHRDSLRRSLLVRVQSSHRAQHKRTVGGKPPESITTPMPPAT